MSRSVRQRLLSSLLTACFAAAVLGWGMVPTCPSGAEGAHQHQGSHGPGHKHVPVAQSCAVHLCCVHLSAGTPTSPAAFGLGPAIGHAGFAPVPAHAGPRPDHTLPFAHAPPLPTV